MMNHSRAQGVGLGRLYLWRGFDAMGVALQPIWNEAIEVSVSGETICSGGCYEKRLKSLSLELLLI